LKSLYVSINSVNRLELIFWYCL